MKTSVALLGCLLAGAAVAQPLRIQLVAAHNDKLQKAYAPYKVALRDLLGVERLRKFQPSAERRIACRWDGVWRECGYLLIRNASLLEPAERMAIQEVMLNPCTTIERVLSAETAGPPDRRLRTSHREALQRLCDSKSFSADAVRVADMSSTIEAKSRPTRPDDLALEARIAPSTEANAK